MNGNQIQTSHPVANDPEELSRLLDIELMQKKAQWQQKTARNKSLKSMSLMFLFLVVMGGLAVFFFVFMKGIGLKERTQQTHDTPAAAPG